MNYQQFAVEVKETVKHFLEPNLNIENHTTLKNNGHERIGISITNKHINISPTIYLEEYFEHYQTGSTIEEIAEDIARLYHEIKYEQNWEIERIKDFENIRSRIAYKLINTEKNKQLLKSIPHFSYSDFSIVFYVLFEEEPLGTATILINYDLLRFWEVSIQEIYDIAHENMPTLLPADFKPMYLAIEDMLKNTSIEYTGEPNPLFVLTNTQRCLGASCILYDDMLKKIYHYVGENYYIIPSSIHEVIIIPESKSPLRCELNEMIKEINDTQVHPEEILSDQAYFYDKSLNYMY